MLLKNKAKQIKNNNNNNNKKQTNEKQLIGRILKQ